jgi:hypothetical protein
VNHGIQNREARLVILRFLADEVNRTLTSSTLTTMMNEMFLFNKERAWVEQELAYLAEMGAVKLTPAGTVKVARLLPHGARHLSWGVIIPEVKRSSEPIMLPEIEG